MSNRFTQFRNLSGSLGQRVLTNDELHQLAPSIFAEDKHESRSDRYTYIPTIEVLEGLRENGFDPVFAKQGRCRIEGKEDFTKHLVRLRHRDLPAVERHVGGLYPEVVLLNSHDGTSRYKLMAGVMRLICLNGMLVADKELASVSVPHKGNIAHQVIEGSFTVIEESRKALGVADNWAGVTLSRDEQLVLAEEAHVLRFGDADGNVTTPIRPDQLLSARRSADRGDDLWRVTNRLQENMIRGNLTAMARDENNRPRRVTTREVRGIDSDVKLNRSLWRLSERMAELKAA